MMRSLCVLVVACAVAAGAALAGHGEVRPGGLPAALSPSLHAARVHAALPAVLVRNGRSRATRASHPSLPPVALAAGWSLDPKRRAITALALPARGRRAERPIRTGSARGPPIA